MQYTLAACSELRFELSSDKSCSIQVLSGAAEMFGSELVANTRLDFTGCKRVRTV